MADPAPPASGEDAALVAVQSALAGRPGVLSVARGMSFFGEHSLGWLALAGLGALTLETQAIPSAVRWVARLTPSGALTEALSQAMTLSVDWFGIAVLAVWGTIGALGALRWFKFS